MNQESAFERLSQLPAIFRGADLTLRFGWTSKTTSQYLYLWTRRGLVAKLGGHSDVYGNLVVDRDPNWETALLMAMPSAVVFGIEALRRAGWTTQIPFLPTVAVNKLHPVYQVGERFGVTPMPAGWFAAVRGAIRRQSPGGLPELAPAWALADMLKRHKGWEGSGLYPDDIYSEAVTPQDRLDWNRACIALGIDSQLLSEIETEIESECPR